MQYNISDLHLAFGTVFASFQDQELGAHVTRLVIFVCVSRPGQEGDRVGNGGRLELMTDPIMAVSCDSTA